MTHVKWWVEMKKKKKKKKESVIAREDKLFLNARLLQHTQCTLLLSFFSSFLSCTPLHLLHVTAKSHWKSPVNHLSVRVITRPTQQLSHHQLFFTLRECWCANRSASLAAYSGWHFTRSFIKVPTCSLSQWARLLLPLLSVYNAPSLLCSFTVSREHSMCTKIFYSLLTLHSIDIAFLSPHSLLSTLRV